MAAVPSLIPESFLDPINLLSPTVDTEPVVSIFRPFLYKLCVKKPGENPAAKFAEMRRPTFRRSPSTSLGKPEYMAPITRSPTQMSFREWDTGFPEPFCGSKYSKTAGFVAIYSPFPDRNTTLRHPDAKPDACITQEDVDPKRALLRNHHTYIARQGREGGKSSQAHGRQLSASSDEGAISAIGRLAINSLRSAERPMSPWSKDADSIVSSDGLSSSSPDSPTRLAKELGHHKAGSRDGGRRRGNSFISRLMHR